MKRVLLSVAVGCLLISGQAVLAKPPFLRKAKELGLPGIDSCQACHISTEPGSAKWNARGLWLKAKKQELHAEDVDVTWLKDYKPTS